MALDDARAIAVQVADIYADRFGAPQDARFALMKLSEEQGELTGAWLQMQGEGRGTATREDVANEVADVLGFLLVFADREGIDAGAALRAKWGRYVPCAAEAADEGVSSATPPE